jgi:hypothetical protein
MNAAKQGGARAGAPSLNVTQRRPNYSLKVARVV